jgi:actin-like ATPase involved in cell morphogenesis
MSYLLGIDLGTTRTAAAIGRRDARPGETEIVNLGDRASAVPSVLYLGDDGSVVVGEAAERRALSSPDHVVREFKRRIGDPTPLIVGGRPWAPEDLSARLVRWVVDRVAQREAAPAARIAITLPASWGPHKTERLGGALAAQGLQVSYIAEPQAAALHYASAERVEPGSTIAVYDFGGGTFDAAVVHKDGHTFKLLGRPEGVDRLGGIDFDEIVFQHVVAGMPEAFEGLDENDPAVLSAIAALRRECVEAKEALSSDTEVSIPVLTPAAQGSVRMHRSEFEAAIRPQVEDTVDALQRAVASAGLAPQQLSAVLLVGGSSRIPLVGQLVSELLGRPVSVDADPKNAIAMGAVLSLQPTPSSTGPRPRVPAPRAGGSARFPIAAAAAGAPPLGGGTGGPQGPFGPPGGPPGGYGPGPMGSAPSSSIPPYRPAPPRPPVAPPPRPATPSYAADFDDEPPFEPQYDYAPEPRGKSPSFLVTLGAVAAAAAVVAAVFLWPRPDVEPVNASTPRTPVTAEQTTEPAPAPTTRPTPTEEPPVTRPVPPPPAPPRPTAEPTAPPTSEPPQTTVPPTSEPPEPTEPPSSAPVTEPSDPPNQGDGSQTAEAGPV